jgi:sister-chromatid-cohesion protein PDS5
MMRYAAGPNHRHAKFAARLIAFHQGKETYCERLMDVGGSSYHISHKLTGTQTITEALPTADHHARIAHITALDQLALLAPAAFETRSDVVMAFLLKKVLMVPNEPNPVFCSLPVYELKSLMIPSRIIWMKAKTGMKRMRCLQI